MIKFDTDWEKRRRPLSSVATTPATYSNPFGLLAASRTVAASSNPMQQDDEPGPEPVPPKIFDWWMIAVICAVIAFLIYGVMEMAGLL